jgi:hypothetical protein
MTSRDSRLDGNAAAGSLRGIFGADLTAALLTCAGCGATAPLAESDLYPDAPALVLRCRGCSLVLLRHGLVGTREHLEMSGIALLTLSSQQMQAAT